MKPAHRPLSLALLLLVVAGCASSAPSAAPPPLVAAPAPRPSPTPAAALPDDDLWVASSAEYAAACWQAFLLARQRVEQLAAGRAPGTWAVAIDADETVLSNVGFEIELAAIGKDYDEAIWRRWVARGEATALSGAVPFLRRVHELGGRIAVVTNREEDQRAPTAANLRRLGAPFDLLLLRPTGGASAKAPRWEAVQKGTAAPGVPPLEILLWVGDNIKDFPGLDQSLRRAGDEALAAFGERFVILPNPMYGSWKPSAPMAAPAPTPVTGGAAAGDGGETTVAVVVEEVQAALLKSLPARLRAHVRGQLPDACSALREPNVWRDGDTFHVELVAVRAKGKVCTQALVPFERSVEVDILGLRRGTYTVESGGKSATFRLGVDN